MDRHQMDASATVRVNFLRNLRNDSSDNREPDDGDKHN
jgi:hypothetical protein